MDIWAYIFPKKCVNCRKFGSYLCSTCFAKLDADPAQVCGVCGKQAVDGLTHPLCQSKFTIDGIFASHSYNQMAKKLLYQYKFSPHVTDLRRLLGELMVDSLIQQEEFNKILQREEMLLTYIPLHIKRERMRGYNQAALLAEEIAGQLSLPGISCLERTKETTTQVGKTEKERRENMQGAFGIKSQFLSHMKGKTIWILDDIVTSGSTLNEAAKVCKKAGAKAVYGMAFAHGH